MLNWTGRRWRSSACVNPDPLSDAYQVIGSSGRRCPLGLGRRMPVRTLPGPAYVNSCFQMESPAVHCGGSSLLFPPSSNSSTTGRTDYAFASLRLALHPLCSSSLPTPTPFPFARIWNAAVETSGVIFRHSRVELDSVSSRNSLRGVRRGRRGRCLRTLGRRGGSAGWCGLRGRSGVAGHRRGVRR